MNRSPIPEEFAGQGEQGLPGASNKQLDFIAGLLAERDLPEEARTAMETRLAAQINANEEGGDCAPSETGITKRRASEFIGRLKELPKRPLDKGSRRDVMAEARGGANPGFTVQYSEMLLDNDKVRTVGQLVLPGEPPRWLLAGRYALHTEDWEGFKNDTTFFHLWIGTRYGWKLFIMASDEEHEVTARATQLKVLNAIANDPIASSARYGHEFERCGVCGRGLTADESRDRGIGPVCASRLEL